MKVCKLGHPRDAKGRCRICDNETRRRQKDRFYQDGLTPQERREQAKRRWTKLGSMP